jgi:hypothetical protein
LHKHSLLTGIKDAPGIENLKNHIYHKNPRHLRSNKKAPTGLSSYRLPAVPAKKLAGRTKRRLHKHSLLTGIKDAPAVENPKNHIHHKNPRHLRSKKKAPTGLSSYIISSNVFILNMLSKHRYTWLSASV